MLSLREPLRVDEHSGVAMRGIGEEPETVGSLRRKLARFPDEMRVGLSVYGHSWYSPCHSMSHGSLRAVPLRLDYAFGNWEVVMCLTPGTYGLQNHGYGEHELSEIPDDWKIKPNSPDANRAFAEHRRQSEAVMDAFVDIAAKSFRDSGFSIADDEPPIIATTTPSATVEGPRRDNVKEDGE